MFAESLFGPTPWPYQLGFRPDTIESALARPFNRTAKRAVDLVGSVALLVLFAPLFVLIAAAIRLDSRGNIFYSHKRLDSRGRPFPCFKFRSMYTDADQRLSEWVATGDQRGLEFRKGFKLKDDPRITRVGRFLRKTSLDELPQLLNVLRGEMSLVGPRPIVAEEVEKYGKDFRYLLMVKGGMTGLWQVSGRNNLDYPTRVALDVHYVRNWSLTADVMILLKTVGVFFEYEGAY